MPSMRIDKRMRGVDGADAHEGGHHRDLQVLDELAQRRAALAVDHAAAGIDQRPLRGAQRGEETAQAASGSLLASQRFMRCR